MLEATTNFQNWSAIATNSSSSNGLFWLSDVDFTNHSYRFYRGRVP